ncbi:hypothetical protein ONZ43_g3364 [Nemania bipapillata]|uniref:Uncharacterized protein n=1 Tax=Nemania bipapillata TaxID=110536 RepID=A0ACC2IXG1_9PEZI|nr:hypothetical protein ONZ43_g3364 [Nemania bipapillata]
MDHTTTHLLDVEKGSFQRSYADGHTFQGLNSLLEKVRRLRTGDRHEAVVAPTSRRRFDVVPRRDYPPTLNVDDALAPTKDHVEYTNGFITLRGLGKFDDATTTGNITESEEADFTRREIEKLVEFAQSNEPPMFDSDGSLKETNLSEFESLSGLADQIGCNFQIIKHDNYRVIAENDGALSIDAVRAFKSSRRQLIKRYRSDGKHFKIRQPVMLSDPVTNRKAYLALVDFVLGVMAWWLVRVVDNAFWNHQLIAVLGQWAVKLKVISFNPVECAEASLLRGEDLMHQMVEDFDDKDAFILKIRAMGDDSDQLKSINVLDEQTDLDSFYYLFKISLRLLLEGLLTQILGGLFVPNRSANTPEAFEACTLIYKTGLDRKSTLLTSERDGDISATLQVRYLTYSYEAFNLLFSNSNRLYRRGGRAPNKSKATRVSFRKKELPFERAYPTEFYIDKIDELISLLVPFALTSTYSASNVDGLVSIVSLFQDSEDPIKHFEPPPRHLELDYTISTAEWISKKHRNRGSPYHDPDIIDISKGPLSLGIRAGTGIAEMLKGQGSNVNSTVMEERATYILAEYKKHSKTMNQWVTAQKTITVDCYWYSRFFISLAIFLVLGSLAIPFTVGERITGVDPFQFVSFTWLFAGFILVTAQSRYVNNWPWHDFLGGRVVCRSVKDLAESSGIDPQMILLYLLHNEHKNTLALSGPFTGVFKRVLTEGDGFVIDVPTQLSTLLAGGLLVFKVLNEKGEHLICIDIRQGSRSIARKGKANYNACMDVGWDDSTGADDLDDQESSAANMRTTERADKVIKLRRHEFAWERMLGLYVKDAAFG